MRAPDPVPARPSSSLGSRLEDVAFTAGASVAGALVVAAMGQSGPSMIVGGASMFLFGLVRGVVGYRREVKAWRKAVDDRATRHATWVRAKRAAWSEARAAQHDAMTRKDPPPRECLQRAERLDVRLFERGPADSDFLEPRIGLGSVPFCISIKPPAVDPNDADEQVQELLTLGREFASVEEAPVCAPFHVLGVGGIAGPRANAVDMARVLLVQLATHHAPHEVKFAVVHPPEEDWKWLRWLPHCWSDDRRRRFVATDTQGAHALFDELSDVLKRRQAQGAEEEGKVRRLPLPVYVIVVASNQLAKGEPLVDLLLEHGVEVGSLALFFADTIRGLPKACSTIVEVSDTHGRLVRTGAGTQQIDFLADQLTLDEADRFSRALAPLDVASASGAMDMPASATLFDLLEVDRVESLDLLERWRHNQPYRSMGVPIGRQAGNKTMVLDLHERAHGPHGLVAGTTGSGKTAFLSTFLALLASQFHPHEVAFVAVDYKGGDLYRGLESLPHLVATLTNLEKSQIYRSLRALQAENERRMRLFTKASTETGVSVSKIDEYQELYRQGKVGEPLPKLLIVCDEFAELAKQEPDFLARLVSTARVGRSLGVHLILATQQPAGIIGDQIESNTRFRIAFKFNKDEDSKAVIKRPDAASLRQPGRAFFLLGENEVFEGFQAAYGGADYAPHAADGDDAPVIALVGLDGQRHRLAVADDGDVRGRQLNQLQALARHIEEVCAAEGIARLPGPWLPPLPERVVLTALQPAPAWTGRDWSGGAAWLSPILGLMDDPGTSFQGPLRIDLGAQGHLAIYGRPGAGATTALQTLLTSLALDHSPADLHIYLMDFGGRALTRMRRLPHVGDLVVTEDADRTVRLLRFLLRQMGKRKEAFAEVGATTLAAYRQAGRGSMPAIVVVIDNYLRFSKEYPDAEDLLATIVQEGAGLGIYLVMTAVSPSSVKQKIAAAIPRSVALQLVDRSEYSLAVGRTEGIEPAPVRGRGLCPGKPPLEFQTALPVDGNDEVERAARLEALIEDMRGAWSGPNPPSVPVVPDQVTLATFIDELPAVAGPGLAPPVPVALDIDDVQPFLLRLAAGPHFTIAGTMQSGKTTLLQTIILSLAAHMPPERLDITLVDFREGELQPLSRLPHVQRFVDDDDAFGSAMDRLLTLQQERRARMKEAREANGGVLDEAAFAAQLPTVLLAVDDFEMLRQSAGALNQENLVNFIKVCRGPGMHVIMVGSVDDLASNSYDALCKAMTAMKTGFLLGTRDDNAVFGNVGIRAELGDLAVGEGFFVHRGYARHRIKVARPDTDAQGLLRWIDRIADASANALPS